MTVKIQECVYVRASAAWKGRHSKSKAMTLVNSKHTTESSLEELSPFLAALLQ